MTQIMPALFIGHGSPTNALEDNRYTRAWRQLGATLPRPRALLVVSAHWFIGATAVTAMAQPRTIHDFYGFSPELFAFEYPAPGLPELAEEVAEAAKPHWVGADRDQWGLDHGTWSVLTHLFPKADVPVVQLSINSLKPLDYHLDLAAKLSPLRNRGVMILASGNVVHNLRRIEWDRPDSGTDWARRFDDAVATQMAKAPADILKTADHPDFQLAVPTPDHFIPLLYTAGRLDRDSEGLLLLTNDGRLQARIADPQHKMEKTYWVQVEGEPTETQLQRLRAGVMLKDGPTLPAQAKAIAEPELWPRDPPIRFRKSIPTHWLEITISEGRNRQVRHMTAAVGLPTLRLVRIRIGPWGLDDLQPGQWHEVTWPAHF